MPGLPDNYSPETSLYRVPGLHGPIAFKRLYTVWQIYVTIIPLKRLWTVCQVSVAQLPWDVCVPCAYFTWLENTSKVPTLATVAQPGF